MVVMAPPVSRTHEDWNKPPEPLITLEQWLATPEDDDGYRREVCEGRIVMAAAPRLPHQWAVFKLLASLNAALPRDQVVVVSDIDVVIRESSLTDRRPDVVVVRRAAALDRPIWAQDVLLVVEVLSDGSQATDLITKKREYAAAGIPEYWIVDLDTPSLTVYQLAPGARTYHHAQTITESATRSLLGTELPIYLAELTTI